MPTISDLATENLPELQQRYDALCHQQAMATLTAGRGGAPYKPLTIDEHLELISLGEAIAFHYRHPVQIHWAVKAGASWPAIAAAIGVDDADVRRAYGSWAFGQHRTGAMDNAAYGAALAAIKTDAIGSLERSAGLVDRINSAAPAAATEPDSIGHVWGPDHG